MVYTRKSKKKVKNSEDLKMIGLIIFAIFFLWLFWQYPLIFTLLVILIASGMVYLIFKLFFQRFRHIKTFEDIMALHHSDFEKFIAFVLRKKGFHAKVRQCIQGDGGIDIDASLNGQIYFIQCKQRKNIKVSEPDMRDFLGAMMSENPNAKGMYVTTSTLSSKAVSFAKKNGIKVWDKHNLVPYIELYTQSKDVSLECEEFRSEEPPKEKKCGECGAEAILREAKKGANIGKKFYGCSGFPECSWVENVGK